MLIGRSNVGGALGSRECGLKHGILIAMSGRDFTAFVIVLAYIGMLVLLFSFEDGQDPIFPFFVIAMSIAILLTLQLLYRAK